MTLIKSISGIRGTIGGLPGEALTPVDIVKFTAAYLTWLKKNTEQMPPKIVVGRDARPSGMMVKQLVVNTAVALGIDVVDIDFASTPTVELAVVDHCAQGGIIITASHNPKNWNALKLLNSKGEFISDAEGKLILELAVIEEFNFAKVEQIGTVYSDDHALAKHIQKILKLPLVDVNAIKSANLKVVVDAVNSVGGFAIPELLKALGVTEIVEMNCIADGNFAHNPEPIPENIREVTEFVVKSNANIGFVVDPDVDRLAIICEDGELFGEEYTLVAVADYVLKNIKGNTVSNLSSTRALRDITEKCGAQYFASAVGEVNVVAMMKEKQAIIGGEGNGGVIYPELHYGRDALVGVALFLTHLVKSGKKCSALRQTYPDYYISKNKIELTPEINVDLILQNIAEKYQKQTHSTIDGVKIEFEKQWVHLRKSNTEPIIRIYSESNSMQQAELLAGKIIQDIKDIVQGK